MNTHELDTTLHSDEISADRGDFGKPMFKHKNITIINGDCMEYMATLADKSFSLAVVDPPYGIKNMNAGGRGMNGWVDWRGKNWDNIPPSISYFVELSRISKNQIVWGGNYFSNMLPVSMCWVIWDKGQRNFSLADGEMAWTSFDRAMRIYNLPRSNHQGKKIHPTQKPVALYRWLLTNYARPGDTILDTHLGSGSSAIAAYELGFEFVGIELDTDYYNAAVERFKKRLLQPKLPLELEAKPTQGELI